jgi:hypothetical protein
VQRAARSHQQIRPLGATVCASFYSGLSEGAPIGGRNPDDMTGDGREDDVFLTRSGPIDRCPYVLCRRVNWERASQHEVAGRLHADGGLKICRGTHCLSNAIADTPTLGYGSQTTVGRFDACPKELESGAR